MIIDISGSLPIKNLPRSPWEQFFDTMITSQDIDGIDLFGKKLPKKTQLLRI